MPPPPSPLLPLSLWDYYPAASSKFLSVAARWRAHQQYLKTCWSSSAGRKGCHCKAVLWFQISIFFFFLYLCFIIAKRSLINGYYIIGCIYLSVWTAWRESSREEKIDMANMALLCEEVCLCVCQCFPIHVFGLKCIFKDNNKTHPALWRKLITVNPSNRI